MIRHQKKRITDTGEAIIKKARSRVEEKKKNPTCEKCEILKTQISDLHEEANGFSEQVESANSLISDLENSVEDLKADLKKERSTIVEMKKSRHWKGAK